MMVQDGALEKTNDLSQEHSYRKVMKNSLIVGGAQFVQLFVSLIRTKVLVLFVGPIGMGVYSLLNSGIVTIHQFTSLGIFQSAVRELSGIFTTGDDLVYAKTRKVFILLSIGASILAALVCILMAHFLSRWIFENELYTSSFYVVALALVFMAFQYAKSSLIQARQQLHLLAKATIAGSLINLLVSLPIVYFFGIKGIAPSIVFGSMSLYISYHYFERKISLPHPEHIMRAEFYQIAKPIVQLGFFLMISNLALALFNFLLNAYLTQLGSLLDVGYYQAAWSICFQSIFIANATLTSDYFPRIAAIHDRKEELNNAVNQQLEMMLYIVAPIAAALIVFAPWIIRILLSEDFLMVVPMLQVMALSLLFRVVWIVFGLLILAKGNKWDYCIYDALLGNGIVFILNIIAYHFWGLSGLAYSICVGAILMLFLLGGVSVFKFKVRIQKQIIQQYLMMVGILLLIFFIFQSTSKWMCGLSEMILFGTLCIYSLVRINKKIHLSALIKSKLLKS